MTKAKDPAGLWEPIHIVQAAKGLIDTSPLWDDDGRRISFTHTPTAGPGEANIAVVNRMSPDGTKLIGDEVLAIDDE